jgi:hypothetical protein
VSERQLPEPIKPRALHRRKNPIHGFDYVTSDGRYEVYPLYKERPNGGTSNRIDTWVLKDVRNPEVPNRYYPLLDDIRRYHCAPDGKVPWLVADMDQGVLRVEPTRAAALEWFKRKHGCDRVAERKQYGRHDYTYRLKTSGEYATSADIVRADRFHRHGRDPLQQPLYPFPDAPYEYVARPGEEEYVDPRRYAERL